MGKRIALRAASLGLVAAGAVGLTCATAFAASSIVEGDTGAGVVCVQRAMNILDGAGLATDGDFGQLTYQAVLTYQGGHGLQQDGQVGPLTGASIKEYVSEHDAALTHEGDPNNAYAAWTNTCASLLDG